MNLPDPSMWSGSFDAPEVELARVTGREPRATAPATPVAMRRVHPPPICETKVCAHVTKALQPCRLSQHGISKHGTNLRGRSVRNIDFPKELWTVDRQRTPKAVEGQVTPSPTYHWGECGEFKRLPITREPYQEISDGSRE
jgi:hypothetical protein